jgi:hypothetical protein
MNCTESSVYKTFPGVESPWCDEHEGWHPSPVTYSFSLAAMPIGAVTQAAWVPMSAQSELVARLDAQGHDDVTLVVSATDLELAIVEAINAVNYCERRECWKWCACKTDAPGSHTHKPAMRDAVHAAIARLIGPKP